jgi:hypothetical protein
MENGTMTDMEQGTRIDRLFGDDYELVAFRDLPEPHRMAMAWYMAINGEAWVDVLPYNSHSDEEGPAWVLHWKKTLADLMPVFDERYGDTVFGIATVGTEEMLHSIVDDFHAKDQGLDLEGVRETHMKGSRHSDYPDHGPEDRWPVVLSSDDDETLQDGWHRFGSYVRGRHADIPTIFYPERRHFLAKGMEPPVMTEHDKARKFYATMRP